MMVLVDVNSGSIWAEAMKNITEGETIQARRQALLRMKLCGIVPKLQILNNEASSLHKQEIRDTNMTYQLVPTNDHQRNIAEKRYKHGRIILSQCAAAQRTNPPSIYGVEFSLKQSAN